MALAAICSDLHRHDSRFRGAFLGYVVDHGVREGSGDEARKVAAEIEKMGISAQVLDLAWGDQDPKVAPNFETLARKLRYRALGTACVDAGIQTLLVAHHAHDQAETVLSRVVAGYMGSGLQGIKMRAQIPEWQAIDGAQASRTDLDQSKLTLRHFSQSSRKVELARPLLPIKKRVLYDICRAKKVKWFEDQTNKDRTLTQRNTVRHLLKKDALPRALRTDSLRRMAAKARRDFLRVEKEATRLFDAIAVDLDTCTGRADVRFSQDTLGIPNASQEDVYHIKASLLRKLLLLVSPCDKIDLQDLDRAMDLVFPEAAPSPIIGSRRHPSVQIAGVNITILPTIDGEHELTLIRAIPTKSETQLSVTLPMPIPGTRCYHAPWVLWDSRYWLQHPETSKKSKHSSSEVRFLTPELIGEIRKKIGRLPHYDKIPQPERWTVPVILSYRDGELISAELPTATEAQRWRFAPGRRFDHFNICRTRWLKSANNVMRKVHDPSALLDFLGSSREDKSSTETDDSTILGTSTARQKIRAFTKGTNH